MKHEDLDIFDLIKIWFENKKTVILITIILTIISTYIISRDTLNSKNIYADFFLINSPHDKINVLIKFTENEKKKLIDIPTNQKNLDINLLTSENIFWEFYEILEKKLISNKILLNIKPQIIKNENIKNLDYLKVYFSLKRINYSPENLEKLNKEIIEIEKIFNLKYIDKITNLQNEYIKYANANIQKEINKYESLINEKKNLKLTNNQLFIDDKNNINIYTLNDSKEDTLNLFLSISSLENRIKNLEQKINKADFFILNEFEENKKYFKKNRIVNIDIDLFKDNVPNYREGYLFHVFIFMICFCFSLILTLLIHLYKKKSLK